ncbi:DUF262 domain-containing protein [Chitinophaga oryzae]|uniref:DUF262 domain-containing protein n=1 Tax=Chitinophaga oryzae TaxID=2725414 RepID=A0AAE7DAI1_9BACT|nr:DUF262 domain-containing protein [Chitinophaga oryzae]QJB35926.1 DUF262 domain-containing protein [Chitinophaga oryzae]
MINMTSDIKSGERLTFLDLFERKGYRIEIPIIQRDYVQGRKSSKEIRETFLETLHDYLLERKPKRDLDFIYGSIAKSSDSAGFIPLDGQQRLTTLFLLHWYLANISGNSATLRARLINGEQSSFTYETRISTKEFCNVLISHDIDINDLLPEDEGEKNSLSKTIKDKGWFYLSWQYDPTIMSMLTMLDAIHTKFAGNPNFYNYLVDETNPVVTFLCLNLDEFKLTDDLYIKMNSRGKPLTHFENFKAKLEQHIAGMEPNVLGTYNLPHRGIETVSCVDYFSHKIDTTWADLFWNYRDRDVKFSSCDVALMNFIRVILTSQYARSTGAEKQLTLEYLVGTQVAKKKKDYSDNITYHKYKHYGVLTPDAITFLIAAFDQLSNGTAPIRHLLQETFYFDEDAVFNKVIKHDLSQELRVQFYAYIRFLIHNHGSYTGIDQWMRIVHNLTVNTVIDSADLISKAILALDELIPYSNDILAYFTVPEAKVDFFFSRQVQEEKLKSQLITRSTAWQSLIESAEKQPYFAGQIMFLFEFSGILAFYEEHQHCNWSETDDLYNQQVFHDYNFKASQTLKFISSKENKSFVWERALLTKGDYLI